MKFQVVLGAASLGAFLLASPARAQEPPLQLEDKSAWFPFVIPSLANARTAKSALDLSFLSPDAAGAHGFLRARGEKIVDGRGREVPLFGTNICDWHVMPPREMALPIAKRLRELGVNFIRLHYYDYTNAPDGIFQSDGITLNPEKLAQMDWLIYQLKQHGIYVDLNLKVARHYPGLPADWDGMGKSLDRVDRRMIELQKRFARDLLNHVNPHTRVAYKAEPAIAVVEINNENSALQTGTGVWFQYARLDESFAAPLRRTWNTWLRARYGTTEKMLASWRGNATKAGPELIRAGIGEWGAEWSGGAQGTLTQETENGITFLRWNAVKSGAQDWNIQLHQVEVPVKGGETVRLRFRARAAQPVSMGAVLMQSEEPWNALAPRVQAALTPEWKQFDYTLQGSETGGKAIRLSFNPGNTTGTFDIADVSLKTGGNFNLPVGASLETGNLSLVDASGNPRAMDDFTMFVGELDRAYSDEMKRLLREEVGVKALIWDTQANYGGAQGLLREARSSDALDVHAYPSHPSGARIGDAWMWSVTPKSLMGEGMGGLSGLTQSRLKGKPFFVTEFDLNPPSDYASESYPMLALFAAYQGVAGVNEYSWLNFQKDLNPSRIQSAFGTTGHTGQVAFMPSAALLFRLGLVKPAQNEALLQVSEGAMLQEPVDWGATYRPWQKVGIQNGQGWTRRFAFEIKTGNGAPKLAGAPLATIPNDARSILRSDSGEITLDRSKVNGETLLLNAPAVRYALGFTGGHDFQIGDVRLQVERGSMRNYGNFSVVSLDGKPIKSAKTLLVTAVARTENRDQKFDSARTTSGLDWGRGPVVCEPLRFSLDVPGANWNAFALDGSGQIKAPIAVTRTGKTSGLRGDPKHATVWYLLKR